ncbi:MAG TPA: beta-ketoacyl-ACP synthase II [Aldersonia sp.]
MSARERVAITGIGAVTPVGIGKKAFWQGLLDGVSGVGPITAFDASQQRVQIAAEVTDFEPDRWLPFRDVRRFDRVGHLGIAAADLALEDRGGTDDLDLASVATIVSTGLGGPQTLEQAMVAHLGGNSVSPLFIPMSMANFAVSAIARRYGFGGPSYSPQSACASSADAIGQGYRMVRDGYASVCLAGGAEASVTSIVLAGFAAMRALSRRNDDPAGACRPFAADRDGFVLGEGAAVLVLEPLSVATARGAHVYAEICGYGQTNDTHHVTAPREDGLHAAEAMTRAMAEAGLGPDDVDYVNAHGTGTALSDPAETAAIKRAFGSDRPRVAVSSTKAMTGHMLGATGAVEAAACALAIESGWIPPTINHHVPDPGCDLDVVPNVARAGQVRAALSNSIAFGGHNVSLAFRRPDSRR